MITRILLLTLISICTNKVGGVCILKNPFTVPTYAYDVEVILLPDDNDPMSNTGYGISGNYMFTRSFRNVGVSAGLPGKSSTAALTKDAQSLELKMPADTVPKKNKDERYGVFQCFFSDGMTTQNIETVVASNTALRASDDTPVLQTVSVGDTVTLSVIYDRGRANPTGNHHRLRWRKDGVVQKRLPNNWSGRTNITLTNVQVSDAGYYEVYDVYQRDKNFYVTFDLKVRACPDGMYGANCDMSCTCAAGQGLCDATTGACTCFAGYYGGDCATSWNHDLGEFGETTAFTCAGLGIATDCKGLMFCIPGDCRCYPTWTGHDCKTEV